MKVVIMCGGVGTRLAEETEVKPKPMVEVGGKPILWHIMMHYAHYGFKDFFVAVGYKGEVIKKYMVDYCKLNSNITVDFKTGEVEVHDCARQDWRVNVIDTGIPTLSGGRLKRLGSYLSKETLMMTWGDGVSNINLQELLNFHRRHGKLATVTAVRPAARFGHMEFNGDKVVKFTEKPQTAEGWINGAFFVLEPGVLNYIEGDDTSFEREPLERLAQDGQLMAYKHSDFWQCMDTLRDKTLLQGLWDSGNPPWKVWESGAKC